MHPIGCFYFTKDKVTMGCLLLENFISWIDGKRILRPEIVKRFPEKIGRYIEVCGGAAWVHM